MGHVIGQCRAGYRRATKSLPHGHVRNRAASYKSLQKLTIWGRLVQRLLVPIYDRLVLARQIDRKAFTE